MFNFTGTLPCNPSVWNFIRWQTGNANPVWQQLKSPNHKPFTLSFILFTLIYTLMPYRPCCLICLNTTDTSLIHTQTASLYSLETGPLPWLHIPSIQVVTEVVELPSRSMCMISTWQLVISRTVQFQLSNIPTTFRKGMTYLLEISWMSSQQVDPTKSGVKKFMTLGTFPN